MSLWFGYEWEIAVSATHADGTVIAQPKLLERFDAALVKHMRHVDAESIGWWLESGGKFYRDASEGGLGHNEYASPECSHPDELLGHSIAAERMMLRLSELVMADERIKDVRVSKANVSHASGESWGSHENYEASRGVPEKPMLAWLASRILITGAGGLDVTYPGIRFTLSPRAHFIEEAVSMQTQHRRGLHNVGKANPYGKNHRVHVVAGDGNRSPLSTWLRFATTALVIRMLDTERPPPFELQDPVRALHDFALDPELSVTASTKRGSISGILPIQRGFLEHAFKKTKLFPDWAPRVLEEWQRVLDAFESKDGWRSLVGQLDWPTKLALFEKVLVRRGWTWDLIGEVNSWIEQGLERVKELAPEDLLNPSGGLFSFEEYAHQLVAEERDPELVREFLELKQQLAAVDARYMELGPDSLFDRVAAPVETLDSSPLELPNDPLELPLPRAGRARVRAEIVREMGWKSGPKRSRANGVRASWTGFEAKGKRLAMPDVAGVEDLTWKELPEPEANPSFGGRFNPDLPISCEIIYRVCNLAQMGIDTGLYDRAAEGLENAIESASSLELSPVQRKWYWRNVVRIYCRQQREIDLGAALEKLEQADPIRLERLWESCNAKTWLGLAGHSSVPELADAVRQEMASDGTARISGIACWKAHLSYWLNRHCRPDEALRLLESTMESGQYDGTSESVRARIKTQFGEARRMLGDYSDAENHFAEARRICDLANLRASLLDNVLTGQARLLAAQGDPEAAGRLLLESVLPEQRRMGMPTLVRTRVLLARFLPDHDGLMNPEDTRDMIASEAELHSGLASCPLLSRILGHWDSWCGGEPDPAPPDGAELTDTLWGV